MGTQIQIRFGFTREKTADNKTIVLLKNVTMLDGEGVEVVTTFLLPKPLQSTVGEKLLEPDDNRGHRRSVLRQGPERLP